MALKTPSLDDVVNLGATGQKPRAGQRVLTTAQLRERVPFSRMHFWRLARDGKFPRPIKLGPRRLGWIEAEIEKWVADRAAERELLPKK